MIKNVNQINKEQKQHFVINNDLNSWQCLMETTGGFNTGELVVIAARPGCGKTTLALNLAVWASAQEITLFESLEMTAEELNKRIYRFVSKESKIPQLWIDDTTDKSFENIELDIIKTKAKFVFIDYLGIMNGNVKKITKQLKSLAKNLNCVIFLLAQLNRKAETSTPRLSMLRDSGNIEQDADQVWFITEDQLIVAKNRKGKTGSIPIVFYKNMSLISEDVYKMEKYKQLMDLYQKAIDTKSEIKFKWYCHKIKQLDLDFYYDHVKDCQPIEFVYITGRRHW